MSECMGNQDLKPTRLMCVLKLLESFIDEYFYLNPISQVSSPPPSCLYTKSCDVQQTVR